MFFTYQHIWKVSFPILISLLIEQLVSITDVIYLGRLNTEALGAAALGATYFIMLFMVPFGFSIGARIMMAQRNGEKRFEAIGPVFYQGISFLLLACLVLIFLSDVFSPRLLSFLIESPAVLADTNSYLLWRVWGLLPIGLLMMMQAFFVAITKTRILTWVSLVMVAANVVLNYLLIFGKFGFPRMEIAGAALASDIAEIIGVGFYIFYFFFAVKLQKYALHRFVWRDFKLLDAILKLSVWTVVQEFGSVFAWFLFFAAIEHLGEKELAVSNVIRSVSSLPYIAVHALSATASSLTGNLIGLKRDYEVLPTCQKINIFGFGLILPLLVLMAVFEPLILRVYTDNQIIIDLSYQSYFVMLSTFIPLLPGWIYFSAVSGTGQTKKAFLIELAATGVYLFYIWFIILKWQMPLAVAWGADFVYGVFILMLSLYYLRYGNWRPKPVS